MDYKLKYLKYKEKYLYLKKSSIYNKKYRGILNKLKGGEKGDLAYEIIMNDDNVTDRERRDNIFKEYEINDGITLNNNLKKNEFFMSEFKTLIKPFKINEFFEDLDVKDIDVTDLDVEDLDFLLSENPAGIIIDDTVIKSLSGPVSFYFLKPLPSVYDSGEGYKYPLIILFGDFHGSKDKMCKQCICDDEKECCYTISDKKFLTLLETLGSDVNPIDFYTETSFIGTKELKNVKNRENSENREMQELTTKEMISCYNPDLRGTDEYDCPTKSIRWHAGDIRFANIGIYNNSIKFRSEYAIKVFNNKQAIRYEHKSYIEAQLYELMTVISEIIKHPGSDSIKNKFNYTVKRSVFGNLSKFKNFLLTLFDDIEEEQTGKFNKSKFSKTLFDLMTPENSFIYKQILKITDKIYNLEFWENIYTILLGDNLKGVKAPILKSIINDLENIISSTSTLDIKLLSQYSDYMRVYIPASLLDIYVVCRILKQPVDGNMSSLSLCFFGNAHIKNILKIYDIIGKYASVCEMNIKTTTNDFYRCQKFDFSLNLTQEVLEHNRKKLNLNDTEKEILSNNIVYFDIDEYKIYIDSFVLSSDKYLLWEFYNNQIQANNENKKEKIEYIITRIKPIYDEIMEIYEKIFNYRKTYYGAGDFIVIIEIEIIVNKTEEYNGDLIKFSKIVGPELIIDMKIIKNAINKTIKDLREEINKTLVDNVFNRILVLYDVAIFIRDEILSKHKIFNDFDNNNNIKILTEEIIGKLIIPLNKSTYFWSYKSGGYKSKKK